MTGRGASIGCTTSGAISVQARGINPTLDRGGLVGSSRSLPVVAFSSPARVVNHEAVVSLPVVVATPPRHMTASNFVNYFASPATSGAAVVEAEALHERVERLRQELRESLAEEAELEAAVSRKRSLVVLNASRIMALERITAERLRRSDGVQLLDDEPGPALHPGRPPPGEGLPDSPESNLQSAGALAGLFGRGAGRDGRDGRGDEEDDDEESRDEGSLEAATAQLQCLTQLRQQVACMEDELSAQDKQVAALEAQVRALPFEHDAVASGAAVVDGGFALPSPVG